MNEQDFSFEIIHDYNVLMIYLTEVADDEISLLIDKLKEGQPIQKNTLTEVSLLHFTGKQFEHGDAPRLLDLIRMYCHEFMASSVYIIGEKNHGEEMMRLFKSNPNYIKSNSLIKFISNYGTPITLRED